MLKKYLVSVVILAAIYAVMSQPPESCDSFSDCPDAGWCNPNTRHCDYGNMVCSQTGETSYCGGNGMVTESCSSSNVPNCGGDVTGYPGCDSETSDAVNCNYADAIPHGGFENLTDWAVGQSGQMLMCSDIQGSVLVGVCGSTSIGKCTNEDGSVFGAHAIQCADQFYWNIDQDQCTLKNATFGEWVECDHGMIGVGRCASLSAGDCGVSPQNQPIWHQLLCCAMVYS
jgi:hypothetical protein